MAAYAAVVSLMNTMEQIMNHPRLSTCLDNEQIQSLAQKLGILLEFIENYNSHGGDEEVECLERKIASAAHTAEDVIESYIVDQIHAGVLENAPTFLIDLHQIIHVIDHIKEEIARVEEKSGTNDQQPRYSTPAISSEPLTTGKTTMVGFDDYLIQLLDGLTGLESGRQVIPIVGMGGVGKTTLARNAYENLLTLQHFDVRAWASISQQYDVKKVLVQLLSTLRQSTEEKIEGELSQRLYKFLCGRRYLIILDDMWSITAWDKIKFWFPEDCNSSRIIVTSRLLEVANDFGSSRVVRMGLLDDNKSWDLFCDKAFSQEGSGCPAELEQIGKAIVKKCKGLPLSIVVIGALLGKSSRAKEYWENIAENISSILSSAEGNECLNILCLSYNQLPAHLKPCFLYMGIFGEDHDIRVSRLIKLWIAEGFIKPNKDKRLEEVAEGYINDLFERSLILVDTLGWNRKFESFRMHDLVRDLCLREAQKDKFFCVMETLDKAQGMDRERCIVLLRGAEKEYGRHIQTSKSTLSVARSLICEWGQPFLSESRLLRVLAVDHFDDCYEEPVYFFQQVNMRFLAYDSYSRSSVVAELLGSIFLLWNLQTLIFSDTNLELEAPVEIWKLRQLRHVEFRLITLPEPPLSDEEDGEFGLHNLQTLMRVKEWRCSEDVCMRIPNIKRLHLYYRDFSRSTNDYCLQNVGRLNKLESLSYLFYAKPDHDHLLLNLKLPASLKELSLTQCALHWDDMRIIGSLPNLQLLRLHPESFVGSEWNCIEGEFLGLKYLEIECDDLRKWNADSCHFPVLDTLVIDDCVPLDGIPSGIGDIPTLRVIRVVSYFSTSVAVSAMKIVEEQETLGNDAIQIQLQFSDKRVQTEFMERVEMEGITCRNFKLNILYS